MQSRNIEKEVLKDGAERKLPGARWKELAGIAVCIVIVMVAWRAVAFEGKTFDGSSLVWGVNALEPPTGEPRQKVGDLFRVDLGASSWQTMPWAEVTHIELKHGTFPFWNPFQAAGVPHAANMQSSVMDPLLLAVNLHPTPLTWDVTILFCFALSSVFTFLFLRNLNLEIIAAISGSAAYNLCGFWVINNNNSYVRTYIYIPLLLLAVDKISKSGKLRWIALLSGSFCAAILAGMPESAFFSLSLAALYALYRALITPAQPRLALFIRYGVSGILGLLLAAPLLVLFLQYLPLSSNVHAPGMGLASASPATILNWLAPLLHGLPGALYPGLTGDRSWSGAAVVALAIVSLSIPASSRMRDAWVFFAAALVLLLKMHGFPGVQWLGKLPFADQAIWYAFAPPVANFCLAAAAAIGVSAIAKGEIRWTRLIGIGGILLLLVGILFISDRPALHPAVPAGAVRHSILIALVAGSVIALATLLSSFARRFRIVASSVAMLAVVLELLMFVPTETFARRGEPYRTPDWVKLVSDRNPTDRVFGFDGILYPDTAGTQELQDVRTLDALSVNRYVMFIRNFVSRTFVDRFTGESMNPEDIASNRMFDLLGVRYVLAATSRPPFSDKSSQFALKGTRDGIDVWENRSVIPRAFVATTVKPVHNLGDSLVLLRSFGHPLPAGTTRVDRLDPEHVAIVETDDEVLFDSLSRFSNGNSTTRPVHIVSYAPDRIKLQVDSGTPGVLVLTDTYFPGWSATVNGKLTPVLPTDVAFRGVVMDSNPAVVEFEYHPKTAVFGWVLAATTIPLFLALMWIQRSKIGKRVKII